MLDPINISDNCQCYNGRTLTDPEKEDLQKLALQTIGDLAQNDNGGLLVFPPNLNEYGDEIGEQHIIQYWNNTLQTGNIMGFVGINNTRLRIHSRFSTGDDDYFLHYMLQRVFSVNLFDLKYSSDSEDVFIEYIDDLPFGKGILENDTETIDAVEKIRMSTPSYHQREQRTIIGRNTRPINHPYFTEYRPLQQICLRILLHEELKYGRKKDDIYGILFDGAWLWEEYLNTILSKCGFNHPQNKMREGGIRVFTNSSLRFYPDFWRKDFVLDAKYKNYGEYSVQSKDYHQIITYMYLMKIQRGGFVVPFTEKANSNRKDLELLGYGGNIKVYGLTVGTESVSYAEFLNYMNKEEKHLQNVLVCKNQCHAVLSLYEKPFHGK